MIMYNTLIGVAAGAALILVPPYWAWLRNERMPLRLVRAPADHHGWAAAFGVIGLLLTGLGFTMTITHPLAEAKPYTDTIFGEPALLLSMLLLAAAWRISRTQPALDPDRLPDALGPVGIIVFILGLVMTWCTLAILRLDVIGAAPAEEPSPGHPVRRSGASGPGLPRAAAAPPPRHREHLLRRRALRPDSAGLPAHPFRGPAGQPPQLANPLLGLDRRRHRLRTVLRDELLHPHRHGHEPHRRQPIPVVGPMTVTPSAARPVTMSISPTKRHVLLRPTTAGLGPRRSRGAASNCSSQSNQLTTRLCPPDRTTPEAPALIQKVRPILAAPKS